MSNLRFNLKKSIAVQLLMAVFSLYFIVTLVLTTIHIVMEYREARSSIQKNLIEYYHTFYPGLAQAIWSLDDLQLQAVVAGMLKISDIKGIRLINDKNKILVAVGDNTINHSAIALFEANNLLGYSAPIHYYRKDKKQKVMVGTITLFSTRDVVIQRVKLGVVLIVVNALIKTAFLWFIFLWLSRYFLSRPLNALTSATREVDLNNLENITVNIKTERENELKVLQTAFNDMIEKLKESVNKRRLVEKELIQAKELAEAASRAKSEFLSNVSHELKTPMNAILGMSHVIVNTDPGPKHQQYAQRIDRSAKLLLAIINNILNLSQLDNNSLQLDAKEFFLDDAFNHVYDRFFSEVQGKGLEWLMEVKKDVPNALIGDQQRLEEILEHLLSNALKFTEHGKITIKIEKMAEPNQNMNLKNQSSVQLKFSIIDTGIGISEIQMGKLFTSFTQVDGTHTRAFAGLGLGLVLSQRMVELMGGEMTVQSVYEKGSTFAFTISFLKQNDLKERSFCLKTMDNNENETILGKAHAQENKNKEPANEIDWKKAEKTIHLLCHGLEFNITEAKVHLTHLKNILGDLPEVIAISEAVEDYDEEEAIRHVNLLKDKYQLHSNEESEKE